MEDKISKTDLRSKKYVTENKEYGMLTHEVKDWDEFYYFISTILTNPKHYLWRGQRKSNWKVDSTLNRILEKKGLKDEEIVTEHLERFKYATRGRRGKNPIIFDDNNEWWAIGQHYGLATPLLDWTTSPFIAAFFAFCEKEEDTENKRAIYALHKTKYSSKLEFIHPLSNENSRLVNQSGQFLKLPLNTDLEEWTKNNFDKNESKVCLLKIILPECEREKILKLLNRMNINHLTLFPDLEGASLHCNKSININKYN